MGLLRNIMSPYMDTMQRSIEEFGKSMREFDEFLDDEFGFSASRTIDKVKRLADKTVIDVPFDKEKQTITFKVENNVFEAVTEQKDENGESKSTVTVSLPKDADTDNMVKYYSDKKKMMKFVFFKIGAKKEEEGKAKEEQKTEQATSSTESTEAERKIMEEEQALSDIFELLVKRAKYLNSKGVSVEKIASQLGVSEQTVSKWLK